MGLLQDWWQEGIAVLERARSTKSVPSSGVSVVPGALPSFLGQSVIQQLAGHTGSSTMGVPPPPQPHANAGLSKRQKKAQRQQQPQANNNKAYQNNNNQQNQHNKRKAEKIVGPCYIFGKMGHLQNHCPQKGKGGGKGRGKSQA